MIALDPVLRASYMDRFLVVQLNILDWFYVCGSSKDDALCPRHVFQDFSRFFSIFQDLSGWAGRGPTVRLVGTRGGGPR